MSNQWRLSIPSRVLRTVAVVLAALLLTACSVPGLWTYESDDQTGAAGAAAGGTDPGSADFDAEAYVNSIWADKVVPAVADGAVEADVLLPALAADQQAATEKYGIASAATGGMPSFLIKGSGAVTEYDPDNPNGPITVKIGDSSLQIVTGPVIIGTALRDAVGFIDFNDFTNQIDYQSVATELNNHVKTDVVAAVTGTDLVGSTVTFTGAFTLLSPSTISVVPTELSVS